MTLTYLKLFKSIELRFYIPLKTKIGHFRYVLPSKLLSILLQKPNTTKNHICINKSKNVITQKLTLKLKPGLIASYDVRPGKWIELSRGQA